MQTYISRGMRRDLLIFLGQKIVFSCCCVTRMKGMKSHELAEFGRDLCQTAQSGAAYSRLLRAVCSQINIAKAGNRLVLLGNLYPCSISEWK